MRSMTGFGQAIGQGLGLEMEITLRGVNHKSLDWNARMPRRLYSMESALRSCVQQEVVRGRIDLAIQWRSIDQPLVELELDTGRADAVAKAIEHLTKRYHLQDEPKLSHWLQVPDLFVETNLAVDEELLKELVLQTLKEALAAFVQMRIQEGRALRAQFLENLRKIREEVDRLEQDVPVIRAAYEQKMRDRLQEFLESDPDAAQMRWQQEVLLFLDRSDIQEELTRLRSHATHFAETMEKDGAIGKKLDFLCQEMNREANTIASKAQTAGTTDSAIALKVQIEQIREQLLNIE